MLQTKKILLWCWRNDSSQTEVFAHEEVVQTKKITESPHRTELLGLEFWNARVCCYPFDFQREHKVKSMEFEALFFS